MSYATPTYRPAGQVAVYQPIPFNRDQSPRELAVMNFLGPRQGKTRELYTRWLTKFMDWCDDRGYDVMALEKAHIAQYVDWLIHAGKCDGTGYALSSVNCAMQPVIGFYREAHEEELIARNPCRKVVLPKFAHKRTPMLDPLDRRLFMQIGKDTSPRHWALTAALCGMALRISEASSLRIEDYLYDVQAGYHHITFRQKGGAIVRKPIPLIVLQAFEAARAGRESGPLIAALDGSPLTRGGAAGLVGTVNRRAAKEGLKRRINPHLLRKAAITEAFEMNMSIRDVQDFARHADPRTTSRVYDLGRDNPHRDPSHLVAARVSAS